MGNLPLQNECEEVHYPESDGEPIADNTQQFHYITHIKWWVETLLRDEPDVFVAADLFWYPVQGDPTIRTAPDTMVVFGRPRGHRRAYIQHREAGIAPQVVFEVLSPNNRPGEMQHKLQFYQQHGVEEYYLYDPDGGTLSGWLRDRAILRPIPNMAGWVSPRLHVRFDLDEAELRLTGPDGTPFANYFELAEQRDQEQERAAQERIRAEQERIRAEQEQARAEQERIRAEQEQARAEQERVRAGRLAARLRALGIDPDEDPGG